MPINHINRLFTPFVSELIPSFPKADNRLIENPNPAVGKRSPDAALPISETVVYIPAACTPAVATPPPSEVTPTAIGIRVVKNSLTRDSVSATSEKIPER